MFLERGQSVCGDETLDAVAGAVKVTHQIMPDASPDAKAAHISKALPYIPATDLSVQRFKMSSQRAFILTNERPSDFRECITDIDFFGDTGVVGQIFRYLHSEDERSPVDDLGLNIFNPVLMGFNMSDAYGIGRYILQIPVNEIVLAERIPILA